jgi:hypothetical protein
MYNIDFDGDEINIMNIPKKPTAYECQNINDLFDDVPLYNRSFVDTLDYLGIGKRIQPTTLDSFHKVGTGKTCEAVNLAECYKKKYYVRPLPDEVHPLILNHKPISEEFRKILLATSTATPMMSLTATPMTFSNNDLSSLTNLLIENTKEQKGPIQEDYYNKFLESLNLKKSTHRHFKHICDTLDTEVSEHKEIKSMIVEYCMLPNLGIDEKYKMLLVDIYNKKLTDFTIHFTTGEYFPCLKSIVQNIPYFELMFTDLDAQNYITINDDYFTTVSIIKLLYNPDLVKISVDNSINIFLQMDKYLIKHGIEHVLNFIIRNIDDMIKFLMYNNRLNDLVHFHDILVNLLTVYCKTKYKTILSLKKTLSKIYSTDLGEHIFLFEKWPTLFNTEQKLKAIQISGKYELLNISKISPGTVLSFLSDIDIGSSIYSDIHKCNAQIYFNSLYTLCNRDQNIIYITSYYPILKYKLCNLVRGVIYKVSDNSINICFSSYLQSKILIGTKLMFSNDILNTNEYIVNEIVKYVDYKNNEDTKKINVTNADYTPSYNANISYNVIVNDTIKENNFDNIYIVTYSEHTVNI